MRGFIFCEHNHKFTASWSTGRNKKYPYYRCPVCKKINIKRDALEYNFKKYLERFEFKEDYKEMIKTGLELNWQDINKRKANNVKELSKNIIELEQKQDLVVEKNIKGVLSDELAKKQLDKTESDLMSLKIALVSSQQEDDDIKLIIKKTFNFLENIGGEWAKLKYHTQRQVEWFLFPNGVPYFEGKFGTTELSLILATKKTYQDDKSSLVDQSLDFWKHLISQFKELYQILENDKQLEYG